ncbi:hypothetical protein, partial [Shewanella frigidimarina]
GFFCSGAVNAIRFTGNSFDQQRGQVLHLSSSAPLPSGAITFETNRIEALYTPGSPGAVPCIQFDGNAFGVRILGNYFENTFTTLLSATNCRNIVWDENFNTNDSATPAAIAINDSQISLSDNSTLVGVVVAFTGTTCQMPRNSNNFSYSFVGVYTKMTLADPVSHLGNGGFSLSTFPGVFDAVVNKLKQVAVPATSNTPFTVLSVTGGSSAVLGSRFCAVIKATMLLDAVDSNGGANVISSYDYLITVWGNAGGPMNSSIVLQGATTPPASPTFSVTQQAGATATALNLRANLATAPYAYAGTNCKLTILYSMIATENNSGGITVS